MKIDFAEIAPLLCRHLKGDASAVGDTVHTRSDSRGGLFRLPLANGGSMVFKVWRIRNAKERLKSVTHLSNGWREWRMHQFVYRAGIDVPAPFCFQQITIPGFSHCEIMAIEDVGKVESGVPYLKRLIAAGLDDEIIAFEDRMIDITSQLLKLKIIDVDNQLNNFLINSVDRVIRIDFECARKPCFFTLRKRKYATMLERLLRSHLHATYPASERTSRFMLRLAERLELPADIRKMVLAINEQELARENRGSKTTYAIDLKW